MLRLSLLVLVGALACGAGCSRDRSPGGPRGSRPEAGRTQAESLAVELVVGAAEAQVKADPSLARRGGRGIIDKVVAIAPGGVPGNAQAKIVEPAPTAPPGTSNDGVKAKHLLPRPGSPAVIQERITTTIPYPTQAEAEEAAIGIAREAIARRLAELDPPVRYMPSANEVRKEFLRRDTLKFTALKDSPDTARTEQMKNQFAEIGFSSDKLARLEDAEFYVEVTAEQVRQLRSRDRVVDQLRVFGVLSAFALAGFLFLRADEWTKGYLTHWLAMAAVLLAGGAAAALYFV